MRRGGRAAVTARGYRGVELSVLAAAVTTDKSAGGARGYKGEKFGRVGPGAGAEAKCLIINYYGYVV